MELKKLLGLIMLISLYQSILGQYSPTKVDYVISNNSDVQPPYLEIEATFPADSSGNTHLIFLNNRWGEINLHSSLIDLKCKNKTNSITHIKDSLYVVRSVKGQNSITICYKLRHNEQAKVDYNIFFRPYVQSDFFHFFSSNLFFLPDIKNLDFIVPKIT